MGPLSGFILILLGFGFLIFVHELGHFFAAKWAGVRADGFAIGMGPCVVSYRRGVGLVFGSADARVTRRQGRRPIEMDDAELRDLGLGETEYSLRAFPLGGFVRMVGQEDGRPESASDAPRSFGRAPIGRRAVIILAGIAANLALAIALFLVAFLAGVRFPAPAIGFVLPGSAAARATPVVATASAGATGGSGSSAGAVDASNAGRGGSTISDAAPDAATGSAASSASPPHADAQAPARSAGLEPGDRIVAIDGDETRTFIDLRVAAAMAKPGVPLEIEVERAGERLRFEATPERDATSGLLSLGVDVARSTELSGSSELRAQFDAAVRAVAPALADAGIAPGARITSIDGRPVASYAEIDRIARASRGATLAVGWSNPADAAGATSTTVTPIDPRPLFESVPAAADGEPAEPALAGLAPLARVVAVVESSLNAGTVMPGDVFLRVGSTDGPRQAQLVRLFRASPGTTMPAVLLRDGARVEVELRTSREGQVGVQLEPAWNLPILAAPIERSRPALGNPAAGSASGGSPPSIAPEPARDLPAASLDALPLATILSVDGAPVADFLALRRMLVEKALAAAPGETVEVRIGMRDPSPEAVPVASTLVLAPADIESLRALGYEFPMPDFWFEPEHVTLSAGGNPLEAVAMGFRQTLVMIEQVFLTIDRVGRGSVGVDQLQGPVGILHTGTRVADEGFTYMLFFLAMISVNLAVVNALPIPIADGGLFLFLVYEKIVGRPPSIAFQNAAAMAGIALVAGLFLLTFYNDLGRIFG